MNSYGLIDLHCDTLAEYWKYAHTGNPDTLDDPGRVLSLSNMPKSFLRSAGVSSSSTSAISL